MDRRVMIVCIVVCLCFGFAPRSVLGTADSIDATLPQPVYKGAKFAKLGTEDQATPTQIYNSTRNEYLTIWSEQATAGYYDLYMARYDAGSNKPISTAQKLLTNGYNNTFITGAYVASTDQYFLVWQQSNLVAAGYDNLGGMVINYAGTKVVQPFWVAYSNTNQATQPEVAYDPNTQNFMVVWTNAAPGFAGYGISAQHVPLSDPAQIDGTKWITVAYTAGEHTRSRPDIAWDAFNDHFVLVYQYAYTSTDRDINAAYYEGDGTQLSVDKSISLDLTSEEQPSIASCPGLDSLFIAWEDHGASEISIKGQLRSGAETPLYVENLDIRTKSGFATYLPDVSCNFSGNAYMVSWWERGTGAAMDALARLYQPNYDASKEIYIAKNCFDTSHNPNSPVHVAGGKSSFGFTSEFQNVVYDINHILLANVSPYAVYTPLCLRTP